MRVSAIRFGTDLWQVLETEAAGVGVSVSQYVREAALMRIAAAATARGEDPFQLLAEAGPNAAPAPAPPRRVGDPAPLHGVRAEVGAARAVRVTSQDSNARAQAAVETAKAALDGALALIAQSEQTGRHRKTRTSRQQRD